MADATDADIRRMKWSGKGYPLYELVAKFSLPILVKSANTSKSDHGSSDGIVAHQVYRILRMLRIETIRTHVLSPAVEANVSPKSQIIIPKDYLGLFKVL